jgi:hypothetical protein
MRWTEETFYLERYPLVRLRDLLADMQTLYTISWNAIVDGGSSEYKNSCLLQTNGT